MPLWINWSTFGWISSRRVVVLVKANGTWWIACPHCLFCLFWWWSLIWCTESRKSIQPKADKDMPCISCLAVLIVWIHLLSLFSRDNKQTNKQTGGSERCAPWNKPVNVPVENSTFVAICVVGIKTIPKFITNWLSGTCVGPPCPFWPRVCTAVFDVRRTLPRGDIIKKKRNNKNRAFHSW